MSLVLIYPMNYEIFLLYLLNFNTCIKLSPPLVYISFSSFLISKYPIIFAFVLKHPIIFAFVLKHPIIFAFVLKDPLMFAFISKCSLIAPLSVWSNTLITHFSDVLLPRQNFKGLEKPVAYNNAEKKPTQHHRVLFSHTLKVSRALRGWTCGTLTQIGLKTHAQYLCIFLWLTKNMGLKASKNFNDEFGTLLQELDISNLLLFFPWLISSHLL